MSVWGKWEDLWCIILFNVLKTGGMVVDQQVWVCWSCCQSFSPKSDNVLAVLSLSHAVLTVHTTHSLPIQPSKNSYPVTENLIIAISTIHLTQHQWNRTQISCWFDLKNLLKFQFAALIFLLISVKFHDKENICYEIDVIDQRTELRQGLPGKLSRREKSLRLLSDSASHQQLHFISRHYQTSDLAPDKPTLYSYNTSYCHPASENTILSFKEVDYKDNANIRNNDGRKISLLLSEN